MRINEARKARESSLVVTKSRLSVSHLTKSVVIPVATTAVAATNTIQKAITRFQPLPHHFLSHTFHCGYSLSCKSQQQHFRSIISCKKKLNAAIYFCSFWPKRFKINTCKKNRKGTSSNTCAIFALKNRRQFFHFIEILLDLHFLNII